MAFARVQGNSAVDDSATTTMSVTISAVGSGNFICGGVTFDGGGPTLTSVTDDKGNTYNAETTVIDTLNGQAFAPFSRNNITNGPVTITANFSSPVSFKKILVDEFSGGSTASTDERDGSAHGGQFQILPGTATDGITSGTFTTATNGDLLYGIALGALATGFGTPVLASNGTGFSTGTQDATDGGNFVQSEFRTQATAGSGTAATFTQAANDPRVTFLIAIKPAAGAADTLAPQQTFFM